MTAAGSPDDRRTTAAYLMWQRHPPPGAWTDHRLAQAQHYRGAVYLALSAVVEAMASARVWLERSTRRKSAIDVAGAGDDEHYVPITDHPLAEVIAAPNPHENLSSLLGYMALQWGLTGNAPLWCVPNRHGRPVELYALPEALLQPLSPTPAYPRGAWRVMPYYPSGWAATAGAYQSVAGAIIPGDELARMKAPHPLFSWDGYSPLTACGVQLDILEAIDRSRHAAFLHGTQFGYIVTVPDATPEIIERVKSRLMEQHAGPDRAHSVVVVGTHSATGSKVSVEPVGTTPREMDYIQSWEQAVKWVLAVFGVPASITGIQSSTSYAEFYAAQVQFHYRLNQLGRRLANFLTRHVAEPWSQWPGELRIKVDIPRPRNQDELRQQLSALGAQGVVTVNEVRAAYDLAPLPGADVPLPVYLQRWQHQDGPDGDRFAAPQPEAEITAAGTAGPEVPPLPPNQEGVDSRPPFGKAIEGQEFKDIKGRLRRWVRNRAGRLTPIIVGRRSEQSDTNSDTNNDADQSSAGKDQSSAGKDAEAPPEPAVSDPEYMDWWRQLTEADQRRIIAQYVPASHSLVADAPQASLDATMAFIAENERAIDAAMRDASTVGITEWPRTAGTVGDMLAADDTTQEWVRGAVASVPLSLREQVYRGQRVSELSSQLNRLEEIEASASDSDAANVARMTRRLLLGYLMRQPDTASARISIRDHIHRYLAQQMSGQGRIISREPEETLTDRERAVVSEAEQFITGLGDVTLYVQYSRDTLNGRAYARPDSSWTRIGGVSSGTATMVHELGHAIEFAHKEVLRLSQAYARERCEGHERVDMGTLDPHFAGEIGCQDHFSRYFGLHSAVYCGKTYANGYTEILSMGLEALYRDPDRFMRSDPEYAQFVLYAMQHAKPAGSPSEEGK